jgi:hypothetical protein
MENRSFSFRALMLAGAAVAGLVGAASVIGEDYTTTAAQAPHLTAAQKADLQPAPAQAPSPPAANRDADRVPGEPAGFDGEEPADGSGS